MSHQANAEFALLLEMILDRGSSITTRNATTKRLRNQMITFDNTPLISVRSTAWKNALREFEWFMSGSSNIKDLHPSVHHWWEPWAAENGMIYNNYSKQFRIFAGNNSSDDQYVDVDQIDYLKECITNHPFGRRSVITTWNTAEMVLSKTPITNCHGSLIQAFVEPEDNTLHLTMYQRSCDMVLGVPHNWIQYWAFLMWLAHHGGRKVGTFTWIGGDCHIYPDHETTARKITALNLDDYLEAPELVYNPTSTDFKASDFSLEGEYDPIIKGRLRMTV